MRTHFLVLSPVLFAAPMAMAERPPIDLELDGETVLVVSALGDDGQGANSESFLAEASLVGTAESVLDNGVRLRSRVAIRVQKDNPLRPGFSGGFGTDPAAAPGAFSGLLNGPVPNGDGDDLRGRFETAYFQIDGGYGELRLGKDQGVAARFFEGAPEVLSHARADNALLDPTGLSGVRTRHDLTGPSAKLSYATPRLLGFRAGLSYTPEADADGLDRRPAAGGTLSAPDTENAIELALNGSRTLRESGFRIDGTLAWSKAETKVRFGSAPYEDTETLSAGLRLEQGRWSGGLSSLNSDNGLPNADYTAWSTGLMREGDLFDVSLKYGEAEDDGANLEATSWRLGVGKTFSTGTKLAVAYLDDEIIGAAQNRSNQGIVVEITLSGEMFALTSY